MNSKNIKILKYIITLVVVFSPLLMMYRTFIPSITYLDVACVLLGILVVCFYIKNKAMLYEIKEHKSTKYLLVLMGAIIFNFLINSFSYDISLLFDVLFRTFRLVYYIFFILIIKDNFFSIKLALTCYKWLALFATFYLFLQYLLLWLFDYSLKGYIPGLTLLRPELAEYTEKLHFSFWARPRSIFSEPSHYAIFVSGYLALSTFLELKDRLIYQLFITLGLILSSSTTGILVAFFIWGVRLFQYLIKHKFFNKKTIAIIIMTMIFVIIYSKTPKFELFISRFMYSFTNRMEGFKYYFDISMQTFNPLYMLFGGGMDLSLIEEWASGTSKILVYFGAIGMIIFVYIMYKGYRNLNRYSRMFFVFLILIGFFSELWVSNWIILFIPLLLNISNYHPFLNKGDNEELKLWKKNYQL